MNVTLLDTISDSDIELLKDLYYDAFPPDERRLWNAVVAPEHIGEPELQGIYVDGSIVGMITTWHFDEFIYIEHFAVDKSMRGTGIGAEVLRQVLQSSNLPVVLEVEPADDKDSMTIRRIGFYKRCGFAMLDYDYIQPPYSADCHAIPLRLMSTRTDISPEQVEAILHHRVYRISDIRLQTLDTK